MKRPGLRGAALALALVTTATVMMMLVVVLPGRTPDPDASHLWMRDVRAAAWSPPPNKRDDGSATFETGCPLGSDTDRSGPLINAWIDALNEANITFVAGGSEALRALRFGSNTVRLGSDQLGLGAHPQHGSHDLDLFAIFPDSVGATAAYLWLGRKFADHPEFECYSCAGSCRRGTKEKPQCCCLRWRNRPPGQAEAGYDWQWTKQIETFNAFVLNQTHVRFNFIPRFDIPIGRLFPLRQARFGSKVILHVAHDFMWFLSDAPVWAGTVKNAPRYNQGCRSTAYPTKVLNSEVFGISPGWDSYANVRRVEKGLFQCAKWLHRHDFASFYGCFDEDIGFGEPEDEGLLLGVDWSKIIVPPPPEKKSVLDQVLG